MLTIDKATIKFGGLTAVNEVSFEVKDGSKPPCKRKLTPDEEAFHASWRGHVAVVESVEDALKIVGLR